jgi:uncharacterized YccA/Bax inhibitor family protein
MQSSNPVFNRSEGFNGKPVSNTAGSGVTYPAYGGPSSGPGLSAYNAQQSNEQYAPGYIDNSRMTIDSVIQKTAITLGVVVLVAGATWVLTGSLDTSTQTQAQLDQTITSLYMLTLVGSLVGFGLAMVNSFKKVVSPGLVLAYAAMQGLFVGAFSKVMEAQFGEGLVLGAVLGTMAAVGGTLAAYKFFDIKVGNRFRTWVVGAMFGFVALSLLDFVLKFFNASFGFNGFGPMGLIASVFGLGLGVLMLILDFDFVERGVEAGLPERESWRAAFGLAVTIIWIYIEILRILAILRGGD